MKVNKMSLANLTLKKYIDGIQNQDFTQKEVYADLTAAVAEKNGQLNAYLTKNESALSEAETKQDTPLAGAPLAVKDNYLTKGLRTTASSTMLDTFEPPFDSTAVHKMKSAGGVVFGKTNLDAWAHGSSTETSQFGRSLNPRNTDYLPGGSSGGSTAAVAADLCIAAVGTETAGSIRLPAAWCGVVGLKPTYGRVSRYGIVSMASSTDSPGPITKTVEDSAILLTHMAGRDPLDATTGDKAVPNFAESLGKSIKGLKIGYLYHDLEGLEAIKDTFETELKILEELGATVEPAKAMDPRHAISVYTIVQRGEVSSNLARYDGIRYGKDRSHFGDEAKRRIMLGTYTLSKGYADQYYNTAQKVRTLFMEDFKRLFSKYDLLVSLSAPSYAKKVGASEGAAMFGELEDMLAEPSSITGLPGINVPCYRDPETNLYLGMNLVAPMWREDLLLQVGHAYEHATDWNSWRSAS